jgi:hypothetical protein
MIRPEHNYFMRYFIRFLNIAVVLSISAVLSGHSIYADGPPAHNPIQLSITSPISGSRVNRAPILVKGTVAAQSGDVGVVVNGVPAQVNGNQFVANHVSLEIGTNTITATATEFDGNNRSVSVQLTAKDIPNPVVLSADPESGIAPLTNEFSIVSDLAVPITTYTLDADGDGVADFSSSTLPGTIPFTYSKPGLYIATVTLIDSQKKKYMDTVAVRVFSLQALDALLKSRWEGMKKALANNEVNKALAAIIYANRHEYRETLTALGSHPSKINTVLGDISFVSMHDNQAEYQMIRVEEGGKVPYFIKFAKDEDGVWRLEFF